MIHVELEPAQLEADTHSKLLVRLINTENSPCFHVVFRLKLPPQIVLLEGSDRIEIAHFEANKSIEHTVHVRARQVGAWTLSTSNFSYRDSLGRSRHPESVPLKVTVVPKTSKPVKSEPKLAVSLSTIELPLKEWDLLEGQVSNVGNVAISQVTLKLTGPLSYDSRFFQSNLGALMPQEVVKFRIPVRANESGNRVPIHVEAGYNDELGRVRHSNHMTLIRIAQKTPMPANRGLQTNAPVTLLFLAADPPSAPRLRLGQEFRDIQEKLQLAQMRDHFILHQRTSIRPIDISQAFLDTRPQIVHFSGHGTESGALCFENEVGEIQLVQPDALAALFELVAQHVQCVVLNACYSGAQADAIRAHIKYVIGMNQAVGDKAAIAFAVGFYQALGAGRSIREAYDFGRVQIRLQGIPEHLTPVLKEKM